MRDEEYGEFDRLFVEFVRRTRPGGFEPNADVFLSGDERTLVVNVEVAAADPASLRVGVDGRHLVIYGRRADLEAAARGSILMKEIAFGEFVKKIRLPLPIQRDDAVASYRDGLLTIRLPVAHDVPAPAGSGAEIKITVRRILA